MNIAVIAPAQWVTTVFMILAIKLRPLANLYNLDRLSVRHSGKTCLFSL